MQIRYAVFDMDGTLINSLIIWNVIWRRLGETFLHDASFRPDAADDRRYRTMTLLACLNDVAEKYIPNADGGTLYEFVLALCHDFYRDTVERKPGVQAFLDKCKANGTRMLIASASDKDEVMTAVHRFGWEPYFETLLSCNDIGSGKDRPDIYLAAMRHFGSTPEETWVFEDSAVALHTAKSLGMKTVGLNDENNYGQDELERDADIYIGKGKTLRVLMEDNV